MLSACVCDGSCNVVNCPCNVACNEYSSCSAYTPPGGCVGYAACSCNSSSYYTSCNCDAMKFAPFVGVVRCFPPMDLVEEGVRSLLKKLRGK